MSADIVHLGAHARMTPEEALAVAATRKWEKVIVCGYVAESDELVVMSSHMQREAALWIVEHLKKHVLGELE